MIDAGQLAALAAVLRSGGFERAARLLGVTSSAISQRIRALEELVGSPLIIRSQPCQPTEAGSRLFRHAEELALLEQGLRRDLGLKQGVGNANAVWPSLRIAVNADSLATWFVSAMTAVPETLFDLVLDDQDHSADWLKRGEVRAAVSGSPQAAQGCDSRPLGALRYIATASPAFYQDWFGKTGVTALTLAQAPVVTFNAKDQLQPRWAQLATGSSVIGPSHWLPSSQAFVDASVAGLGWGMNPQVLVEKHIAEGRLMPLIDGLPLDVPLYWHVSRSIKVQLKPLTDAVVLSAKSALQPIELPVENA
ncbi:LysR family transcriptional regulator ArgP [Rhizobium sp. CECT 9324]|uniref:LysR family transcriptional regulator ArgP n=1 Tax=Rhizobium sp. CECT 9324 TaxID=2845820 RepID=UPI001E571A89|nr:LysR family transcriptional regulator ArgP [Rhizobium sp. CECT 9324]CAH0341358.1 putative HTH-type transcriptional regulator [Rhizobium sp. CECT 9324]